MTLSACGLLGAKEDKQSCWRLYLFGDHKSICLEKESMCIKHLILSTAANKTEGDELVEGVFVPCGLLAHALLNVYILIAFCDFAHS